MLLRLCLGLLWLTEICMAVNCYSGVVYNKTVDPSETINCPIANYCIKISAVTPVKLATYGCDQSASLCRTNGCYDNQNNGLTCCCNTELCNTSRACIVGSVLLIISSVCLIL